MPLKLYNSDLSPFATRVRILAHAKNVKLEYLRPPGGALKTPEYLAINPLGKVPCLVTDDATIPESEVICEFLEDTFPTPTLRPVDPEMRAKVRLLSRMADLYIMPQLNRLFPQLNPKTCDTAAVEAAYDDLGKALGQIELFLEGPDYAAGGRLSLADCTLMPILFFIEARINPAFNHVSHIGGKMRAYYEAAQADPHIAKGLAEMKAALDARMKAQAAG
jgi:glutathione S-transferase